MIFAQIRSAMKPGTTIPGTNYTVKGIGKRRGEAALVYFIPNNHGPKKPSEKGVAESEWQQAHDQLMLHGEFSRKWFKKAMMNALQDPCNFTVIGKVFVSLGMADHEEGSGTYTRRLSVPG